MSYIHEQAQNKKPLVCGLADDVFGGPVTCSQPDGSITIIPGMVIEQFDEKDLQRGHIQKDLRYARKHGLPDLTVHITRAENEAINENPQWRRR